MGADWRVAWTAQVYVLGTTWGLLALLALIALLRVNARARLLPRLYYSLLVTLLLALSAISSLTLFYDILGEAVLVEAAREAPREDGLPPAAPAPPPGEPRRTATAYQLQVTQFLADTALPCLPAAFAVFFFVLVRVNHVTCTSRAWRLQTPAFLCALLVYLASAVGLEVAAETLPGLTYLRVVSRGLTITAEALLGLSYACLYRPLRRAAAKKQAEQLRAAFTAFRRPPTPALPRVVNALLCTAVLLLVLAGMQLYLLMDTHLLLSARDWRVPPWWCMWLGSLLGELLACQLLLWSATRGPPRSGEERSAAPRSSRGGLGLGPGALSLVSCAGTRFLFDCPSTGSEENKNSEDNAYPAVCASNHAILNYTQHTGNKLYDDSFPLANLHSVPLSSSGDDFSSVPTMPKRPGPQGHHKAGTLGPSKPRRPGAGGQVGGGHPGHHTLGPGGQLYASCADDSVLRYGDLPREHGTLKRGSRTTGRPRKTRHNKHRDDIYSNCPQDDDYDQKLDGLADEFQVFKQYASTGSSESADNYDVPILVQQSSHAEGKHRHRGDRADRAERRHHERERERLGPVAPADSLSPASPSDLSDCDRLSSNRSSYDESAPMRPHHAHAAQRGKALLRDLRDREVSEDDVTPDSAVVADITACSHSSPREKRPGAKRVTRRRHVHDSPSSPELLPRGYADNVWSPQ